MPATTVSVVATIACNAHTPLTVCHRIESTMFTRLAIAASLTALLLIQPAAAAIPVDAGATQVLTGRVLEVLPQHLLVVQSGARRVLVYADAASTQLGLRSGQIIRIEGQVPRDWLQLSADELQARRIEVLN